MALGLPRGWLRDTAALYARVFRRGAQLALRNWWVGLVVIVYAVLLDIVAVLTAPLGIVGGLLAYLALVACFSSWLSLVAQVIQTGRIRLEDVPTSFATYFGDLLNVGFLFWGLKFSSKTFAAVEVQDRSSEFYHSRKRRDRVSKDCGVHTDRDLTAAFESS